MALTVTKVDTATVTISGTLEEIDALRYSAQYQQANDTTHTMNTAQAAAIVAFETALE